MMHAVTIRNRAMFDVFCVIGMLLLFVVTGTYAAAQSGVVFDDHGVLHIILTGRDGAIIECYNHHVRVNGVNPLNEPLACDQITGLNIQGSYLENDIFLDNLAAAEFPGLNSIIVDGGAGDDRIAASELRDTLFGGSGNDLFIGTQPDDTVNAGPGNDLFMEATKPLGPPSAGRMSGGTAAPLPPAPLAPGLITDFAGPDFLTNSTNTGGYVFIPPDPMAATGPDHVVSVVNVTIQWHTKAGVIQNNTSLASFFSSASPAPTTFTFDPKVIYDQYEDRFVVVTLEKVDTGTNPSPGNISRIYLAVSDDSDPNGTWYFQVIDAKVSSGGLDYWFDYPGFTIDEQAIYITGNMFRFVTNTSATFNRLWIVAKGAGSGGLYDGGTSGTTSLNPAGASGYTGTVQPAHVFGAAGVPGGSGTIGTFLINYSSLTYGGPGGSEVVSIIRLDDPLGSPAMSASLVTIGDIEDVGGIYGFPALPDAPQSGTATLVEVNDRRTLHAVWRNDRLWVTTTVNPNVGSDVGQTTAHWWVFNTSAVPAGAITLVDQGNIGGEDIASGTYTFFPTVAVDQCGNAGFGFSASAATIYPGAYYSGRYPGDAAGTTQTSGTLYAGTDYYIRTFGGPRNRWGDYSGIALDPANEATFWVFNEYAMTRGTIISGEDGRWATRVGSFASGLDFGDLPSAYNLTIFADDGARHCLDAVSLGASVTPDGDGQENATAAGDTDNDSAAVSRTGSWSDGTGDVSVTVSGGRGCLSGWLDFWDGITFGPDNDFADTDEQIIVNQPVAIGSNPFSFPLPLTVANSQTFFARFRLVTDTDNDGDCTDQAAPGLTGLAVGGEVEDYRWSFSPTALTMREVNVSRPATPVTWGIGLFLLAAATVLFWRKRYRLSKAIN